MSESCSYHLTTRDTKDGEQPELSSFHHGPAILNAVATAELQSSTMSRHRSNHRQNLVQNLSILLGVSEKDIAQRKVEGLFAMRSSSNTHM